MARILHWISIAALVAAFGLGMANAAERPKKLLIGLLPGESAPTVLISTES
jgi:phosphonate transport system substrate-binding protein